MGKGPYCETLQISPPNGAIPLEDEREVPQVSTDGADWDEVRPGVRRRTDRVTELDPELLYQPDQDYRPPNICQQSRKDCAGHQGFGVLVATHQVAHPSPQ